MTISVIALVTISLFYVLGYRADGKQTGLVQFVATPQNATVEIDGKTLSPRTPTKETVSAGLHEFVMWREGYETWRKRLDISPGTLTWLNYTRLIPKERTVEAIRDLGKPAATIVSLDRRFMAVLPDATKPTLSIYDLTRETLAEPQSYTLEADSYTNATKPTGHKFSLVEWDTAGRFMTIRHQYTGGSEWLVFDRQSGKTRSNVTKVMDIEIQELKLMDGSGDHYLALIGNDVREIDLDAETLSRPLVSDVSGFQFDSTSGTVSYIELPDNATGSRKVGIVKENGKPVIMYRSDIKHTEPLAIRTAHYFNKDYVAVAEGDEVTIYSGDFPDNENENMERYATYTLPATVTDFQISPTGRFVLARSGNQFVGYDIERKKLSNSAQLPAGSSPLKWLDDFIVYYEHGGILTVREFDGANLHDLHTVSTGFLPTLSPNGKYLYSVGPAKDGTLQLQRLQMILDN